jgi:hypothetical protein
MDVIQEKHERAVGDAFIDWYNKLNGAAYQYYGRGADPPDLVYTSGTAELPLEITGSYYDADHATMLWQNARAIPEAPDLWIGKSPDQKLVDDISLALEKKSRMVYPFGCVLVVEVNPDVTTAEEFADLMPAIHVPAANPFGGIYVGGFFQASYSGSAGGYVWWRLSPA